MSPLPFNICPLLQNVVLHPPSGMESPSLYVFPLYLHDTPVREDFKSCKTERSGNDCILRTLSVDMCLVHVDCLHKLIF